MTVKAAGRVSLRPSQRAVTSYDPGRASRSTMTVAMDVSPPTGRSRVVRKAREETVLPGLSHASPFTVIDSWPPRAMTRGRTTMFRTS
ncbi:hypothetical protein HEP87_62165 [Streptomyces sp. S1D4-11]